MWARRLVTRACSVACASCRYWRTMARPVSACAESLVSILGFVAMGEALPRRRRPKPAFAPCVRTGTVASHAQAPRGRHRRPAAVPLEPRQGLLSRDGVHQGAGDRLLHAHRPGPAAAPARPPADPEALPRRRRRSLLLREAVPAPP